MCAVDFYLSYYLLDVNPHFVLELKSYQKYFKSERVQMKFPVSLFGRRALFLPSLCLSVAVCASHSEYRSHK